MNDKELVRKLNSVGKAVFVEYFYDFQSYGNGDISKEECIERLVFNEVSNDNGAAIRCSNAKKVFQEGMQCDALNIIIDSKRLSVNVLRQAKQLISEAEKNN